MKTVARATLTAGWILSLALVVYLSLQPGIELPGVFWNADKLYHMLAYGWLGGLAVWFFAPGRGRIVAFCLIPFGGILEWLQSFVPGREASMGDAVANALGVFVGIWLAEAVSRRLFRPQEPVEPVAGDPR